MTDVCSLGSCSVTCEWGGCFCSEDDNGCECYCLYHDPTRFAEAKEKFLSSHPDKINSAQNNTVLSISTKGGTLSQVASSLNKLSVDPIFVPASRANEIVSLEMKQLPLSEILKVLGLITIPIDNQNRNVD